MEIRIKMVGDDIHIETKGENGKFSLAEYLICAANLAAEAARKTGEIKNRDKFGVLHDIFSCAMAELEELEGKKAGKRRLLKNEIRDYVHELKQDAGKYRQKIEEAKAKEDEVTEKFYFGVCTQCLMAAERLENLLEGENETGI